LREIREDLPGATIASCRLSDASQRLSANLRRGAGPHCSY
jgi:hypothetical protein